MNLPAEPNNYYFKQNKLLVIDVNDDHWLLIEQPIYQCLSDILVIRFASIEQTLVALKAWEHQEWELPQLILLNFYLPDKRREWQLLEQLKSMSSAVCCIPVVIVSSSTSRSDVIKAYQLGAAAYLLEPPDLSSWVDCFLELRTYWWKTVALPPLQYGF